jgi:hypothetical protein
MVFLIPSPLRAWYMDGELQQRQVTVISTLHVRIKRWPNARSIRIAFWRILFWVLFDISKTWINRFFRRSPRDSTSSAGPFSGKIAGGLRVVICPWFAIFDFSLGPVYEFVCDSFRTGKLNCFRVKWPWRSTWHMCETWIRGESPENDPALKRQCRHSSNFEKRKAIAILKCL